MRTFFSALVATCLGAVVSPAHATEGLAWDWDIGKKREYLIQAQVRLPEFLPVKSAENTDIRLVEYYLGAVTTCVSVAEETKKVVELRCTFSDVEFHGAAPIADANRGLVSILNEWDALLLGATAQILYGRDGRIRNVSLEGIDGAVRRERMIEETVRLVLLRGLASLDLQMPKRGDDKDEVWLQKASIAMGLVSSVGSFGGVRILHEVTGTEGTVVTVDTTGTAVIASGEMVGAPGGERPRNTYDMEIRGRGTFDLAQGTLLSRDYLISGTPTASSILATGTAGTVYVQAVHIELIPEGVNVTPMGENRELAVGELGL